MSGMPSLPTIVHKLVSKDSELSRFRIVTVQQLLPKKSDFKDDIKLDKPSTRSKHKQHVSEMCKLTWNTLKIKAKAEQSNIKPYAGLIVFPEVSIHEKDQIYLKRLADKTGAMVFAGLVFKEHNGKIVNVARWFIRDYVDGKRQWIIRDQGKFHLIEDEINGGVTSYRPVQHIIELHGHPEGPFRITGSICYDATDISLTADLRNLTDLYVITAYNKDTNTFDTMASALQWHMYQHVVICNIGEYGGSTIQAPYKEQFHKVISHVHGVGQISINTADIDLGAFNEKTKSDKKIKTKPAGKI
jgi:hypothetical protein